VTGADGMVGRALLAALRAEGVPTLAIVRQACELPADRVVVGNADSDEAASAIRASTILFALAGTLRPKSGNSIHQANLRTAAAAAAAVRGSAVQRIIHLSYAGADERSTNDYLRAKGKAEQVLRSSGRETVVFRATHIIGPPDDPGPLARSLLARRGGKARVLGSGRNLVMPVYLDDVVAALVAASKTGGPGTFELAGPDRMTLDDLARLLNHDPALRISHVPPALASLVGRVFPSISPTLVEVVTRDSVGDAATAAATFGIGFRSLREAWGRTPAPSAGS
jgi:NADH dehydrogenase